jgi:hypothetical protein
MIGTLSTETEEEEVRVERLKTMGPEKIAPLSVFLSSELSDGVSGQIFGVRRNEIFLFSQPRPIRSVQRDDGWTPETLGSHMMPALSPDFYPLDRSADIFNWDPI